MALPSLNLKYSKKNAYFLNTSKSNMKVEITRSRTEAEFQGDGDCPRGHTDPFSHCHSDNSTGILSYISDGLFRIQPLPES